MFEIIPETQIRQEDYERKDGMLRKKIKKPKSHPGRRQNKCQKYASSGKKNVLQVPKEFPNQITQ